MSRRPASLATDTVLFGGAFHEHHSQTLSELQGSEFGKSPSDSTLRRLLDQMDVPGFETLLRNKMAAQPGVAEGLDTLVCDDKNAAGRDHR